MLGEGNTDFYQIILEERADIWYIMRYENNLMIMYNTTIKKKTGTPTAPDNKTESGLVRRRKIIRKNEDMEIPARRNKITRMSVVDQVCTAIKQDIADGVWKQGEKIPSEGEFAQIFGVNRLSVRMALQKLNTLGIIETRVGEGSFVKVFSLQPFLDEISIFYEDDEHQGDVQQLRNLLEGECTNLAIRNATPEEIEQLKHQLEIYKERALEYNKDIDDLSALERLVDADLAFHYQVIKMSHNRLYKDIYFMITQLVRRNIAKMISGRAHRRAAAGLAPGPDLDTHIKIYESILHGDAEAARYAREELLGIIPVEGMDVFPEKNAARLEDLDTDRK